jgi:aspartate/methionine/tyrosine aminotransferase
MRFAKRTNWDLALNPLARALAEHRAAGKPLIDLTMSNPTECGLTYNAEAILAALHNPAALKYEPNPKGLQVARQAVAEYYADRGDVVPIEDVFITTSTSEGYSWLFRLLCEVGDEVLIPSPGYPLFDFLADLSDVKLVRYPLFYDHGWHFDFHAMEQATTTRTRAVIVVHPNNPTGNYCKPQERERLNQICAERGLALIADEVFLDFALDGVPRASFVTNGGGADAPLTFNLSGISKICGLPQMKVAWVVVSGDSASRAEAVARLEMIADTYLSVNAPLQLALQALLATRRGFQMQLLSRVRANLTELERRLLAGADWKRLEVEGGWSAVLTLPGVLRRGAVDFEREILARGVFIHPGHFYGFPSAQEVVVGLLAERLQFEAALASLLLSPRGLTGQ